MSKQAFKTMVIVNPNSSNGATGKAWPRIEAALTEQLGTFEHHFTQAPREATQRTREALAQGFEMVVSVGGDGTHNEISNGFFDGTSAISPEAVLGVVTSGTGGDFRKTFGVDKGPLAAIKHLGGDETRRIDVGRMTYLSHDGATSLAYFVNILSFGIGGLVDHMVNRSTKVLGGKASFFIGTVKALAKYKQQTVRVSLDDGPQMEWHIHNVAVANGKFFGGGMMVAPDAEPDDGLFDIVSFVDMSTLNFMGLGSSIYKGKHLAHPKVTHHRVHKLHAVSDDRVLLDMDGEQPGTLPITIENLAKSLRLKI